MSQPFDFSAAMRLCCEDICTRHPEFRHIRMSEVAVTFAQARRRVLHGLQAKLTPMRFERGALEALRDGQMWTVQRLFVEETEVLYILTFYLPRFLNQSYREKLITIFHELYHISEAFDGDIRRLAGHYHVHSHSQREYDRQMGVYLDEYLEMHPPEHLFEFLKSDFRTLQKRHGAVVGLQVPIPKLMPVNGFRESA